MLISPYLLTGKQVLFWFFFFNSKNKNQKYQIEDRISFLINDEYKKKEKLYTLVTNVFRILKYLPYLTSERLHDQ